MICSKTSIIGMLNIFHLQFDVFSAFLFDSLDSLNFFHPYIVLLFHTFLTFHKSRTIHGFVQIPVIWSPWLCVCLFRKMGKVSCCYQNWSLPRSVFPWFWLQRQTEMLFKWLWTRVHESPAIHRFVKGLLQICNIMSKPQQWSFHIMYEMWVWITFDYYVDSGSGARPFFIL